MILSSFLEKSLVLMLQSIRLLFRSQDFNFNFFSILVEFWLILYRFKKFELRKRLMLSFLIDGFFGKVLEKLYTRILIPSTTSLLFEITPSINFYVFSNMGVLLIIYILQTLRFTLMLKKTKKSPEDLRLIKYDLRLIMLWIYIKNLRNKWF